MNTHAATIRQSCASQLCTGSSAILRHFKLTLIVIHNLHRLYDLNIDMNLHKEIGNHIIVWERLSELHVHAIVQQILSDLYMTRTTEHLGKSYISAFTFPGDSSSTSRKCTGW